MGEVNGNLEYIRLIFHKCLPDYIFEISSMEGNPITMPEVMTLLDGTTIGGHRTYDVDMITNLKNAYRFIDQQLVKQTMEYSEILRTIHTLSSIGFIDTSGRFRDRNIRVGGTSSYKCLDHSASQREFENNFGNILSISNKELRITTMYCWLIYVQFFEDCNKRTARMFSNFLAMQSLVGIFTIHHTLKEQYFAILIRMFDTHDFSEMIEFLRGKCIMRFTGNEFTEIEL